MGMTFAYSFRERVFKTIQRYQMLSRGARPLIAVSGGIDSTAVLDALWHFLDDYYLDIHLCHINHGLRGDASNEDERFVIAMADRYRLPLTVRRFEPDEIERVRAGNLEEAARDLRYEKLAHTAEELSLAPVVTGHTRSDQAETVLHRVFRSSGISGLTGILPIRMIHEIPVIRPLLGVTREEVVRYADEMKLEYRHDAMNEDESFTRVKIRKTLLPMLRDAFNPKVEDALAQLAELAQDDEAVWARWLEGEGVEFASATDDDPGDRLRFANLMRAQQRRLLRHIVSRWGLSPSMQTIDDAIDLLTGERPQGEIHFNDEVRLYRRYDRFYFGGVAASTEPAPETQLKPEGSTVIPELGVEVVVQAFPASVQHFPDKNAWVGEFDADKAKAPLMVRTRRDGDVISPSGMNGAKKVKKVLQENRIPHEQRDRLPILFMDGEAAWVPGCCISRSFRVEPVTSKILRVTIRPY